MKRTKHLKSHISISVVLFVLVTGLTFQQHAEAQQFSIEHSVFGNGGGEIQNGSYRIVGTVGQPMTGVASSSSNTISSGFWYVAPMGVHTPKGTNVMVEIPTATGFVALTFDKVNEAGTTSLTTSRTGQPLPAGFKLGDPPAYYNLTTTADFDSVIVCIDYSGVTFNNPADLGSVDIW